MRRELTDREEADPDFVIVRSDGQPVFHLVNVVDDLEMGITHVIRGEDHLSNTAKHIALFRAFGVQPPHYAHIPLILNADGTKMSKRDQGASLTTYLDEGYVPEAVVNYLCLLGWSPKDNREKLSLADVIERFDLPQILRHNARFDMTKLLWLQRRVLRANCRTTASTNSAVHALGQGGPGHERLSAGLRQSRARHLQGQDQDLHRTAGLRRVLLHRLVRYRSGRGRGEASRRENKPRLQRLRDAFAKVEPFNYAFLEACLKNTAGELGVKPGVLVHPTRLACTGKTAGPSLYHLLEVLGRTKVLARLDAALK